MCAGKAVMHAPHDIAGRDPARTPRGEGGATGQAAAAVVMAQQSHGFRRLRFMADLEPLYQTQRDEAIRCRARPVAISALVLYLIYSGLDLWLFPFSLASQTVLVRLALTCPLVLLVLFLSRRTPASRGFTHLYGFAYAWSGLGMVAIIALARWQHIPMPYDGMLLMLMFGYFVMGLSFRVVSVYSALILVVYLWMERALQLPDEIWLSQAFFLLTANVIGMVGSWLQEYHQRSHFLDRCLLEQARQQAEADSEEKSRFLAIASHDLRQPLHVINLLIANLADAGGQGRATILEHLNQSVHHLNHLLGSLLDISRLRQGVVTCEPTSVALAPLFARLAEEARQHPQASDVYIELDLLPDLHVRADALLLERALRNLVNNALEHARARRIRLAAWSLTDGVRLTVEDDGVGIDPALQTQVFEAFFQADQHSAMGGLGLGLAIVRQLTQLMGGRCGVSSAPGAGSRFWMELPPAALPVQRLSPEGAAIRPGVGHILLVDDQDASREWQAATLRNWGYRVSTACRLHTALEVLQAGDVDLIMTDYRLPDGEGLELVGRTHAQGQPVPVIMLTADAAQRQHLDRERHLWVLHKPLPPARLRVVLERLGRRSES